MTGERLPPPQSTPGRLGGRGRPLIAALLALAVLCGCSGGTRALPKPLAAAPEPAASHQPAAAPAGRLVAVGRQPEGIVFDAPTDTLVVAVRGTRPGLDLLDGTSGRLRAFVPLDGAARHLALAGPGGPVLVPNETDDRLDVVSLPEGKLLSSIPVGRQPHDAAALGGTYMVSNELADSVDLISASAPARVIPAPLQPGGVAADASTFVVVGVRARELAAYRPDGTLIAKVACGQGPTHVVAGPGGYYYVADTNGGALLVFDVTASSVRQVARIPVGAAPYGLEADPASGWVFVTLTGSNQVVGLRLSAAKVTARRLWATARQPNSVALDTGGGFLAVTATAEDRVELIPVGGGS